MTSTGGPPSQDDSGLVHQSAAVRAEESAPLVDLGRVASPALSGSSGVPELSRAGSTPLSDEVSLRSHVSIPVVGTFPLGSLRVHRPMDSPRPQRPDTPVPGDDIDDDDDDPEMPPLEGDDRDDGSGPAPVPPPPQSDIFLILDLPPNSTVGCDSRAIGTGTSGLQGIRDIPPGAHFIWVSEPNALSRCGYWFVAGDRGRVRVKQWDRFNEVLVEPASSFEARDHRDNVASLYPQLAPYGFGAADDEEEAQLWRRLTACIDERLLARVTGRPGAGEWLVDTADGAAGDDAGFPRATTTQTYQTLAGRGGLRFLFPEGDVDLHLHLHAGGPAPDTSRDVLRLVDTPGTGVAAADLVGEMQLAFLAGLHLSNLACVEHWWHLVLKVVLRAHDLALLRPGLALAFLTTLHAQMVYNERYVAPGAGEYGGPAPGGASASILDILPGKKARLRAALALYKQRMDEMLLGLRRRQQQEEGEEEEEEDEEEEEQARALEELGRAFVALEAWFWRLGWDLRTDHAGKAGGGGGVEGEEVDVQYDEDDEYRPVIVDLDDTGREVGLVSFH